MMVAEHPLAHGNDLPRGIVGCGCSVSRIGMVSGEDNCPVHGFGGGPSADFKIKGINYALTSGRREERRAAPASVILRVYLKLETPKLPGPPQPFQWASRSLFWYPGTNPIATCFAIISEREPVESVQYLEAPSAQLNKRLLHDFSERIARSLELPRPVLTRVINRYTDDLTFYLTSGAPWPVR